MTHFCGATYCFTPPWFALEFWTGAGVSYEPYLASDYDDHGHWVQRAEVSCKYIWICGDGCAHRERPCH